MNLKIILLKSLPHLPGANELIISPCHVQEDPRRMRPRANTLTNDLPVVNELARPSSNEDLTRNLGQLPAGWEERIHTDGRIFYIDHSMWGDLGGGFKNTYELLNLRALKFSSVTESTSFNVWVKYFVWNFKGTLWNSTQNIIPIHWKIWFLYNIEILRALGFKSSYSFLKCPPEIIIHVGLNLS